MRPWQNKKAILAAVLLVAAAAGGFSILSSRRDGEEPARAKSPVVKAQVGGPRTVAVRPASTPERTAQSGTRSVPGAAVARAQGAAAAVAKAQAPAAQVAAGAGSPSATPRPAASAEPAAQGGPGAAALAQQPESDPTDRLASWVRPPYYYASLGRRDPFGSLVSGDFQSNGEVGLVDVGDMKLVGIAWDEIDRFAMVEDSRGFGHALREGDPVRSGRVLRIERDSVTFLQTSAGESTTITIELPIPGGD